MILCYMSRMALEAKFYSDGKVVLELDAELF